MNLVQDCEIIENLGGVRVGPTQVEAT